jgi:hypothetical protein
MRPAGRGRDLHPLDPAQPPPDTHGRIVACVATASAISFPGMISRPTVRDADVVAVRAVWSPETAIPPWGGS